MRITTEHVRNLKHDITFIKRAHDLRAVGEGKAQGSSAKAAPPRYFLSDRPYNTACLNSGSLFPLWLNSHFVLLAVHVLLVCV